MLPQVAKGLESNRWTRLQAPPPTGIAKQADMAEVVVAAVDIPLESSTSFLAMTYICGAMEEDITTSGELAFKA